MSSKMQKAALLVRAVGRQATVHFLSICMGGMVHSVPSHILPTCRLSRQRLLTLSKQLQPEAAALEVSVQH